MLSVRRFTPREAETWRTYVSAHPDGTFFHELPWKRAVERTFGHRSRYLIAFRRDRAVGVLPAFEIKSVLAGRLIVSLPYATYGGLLSDDSAAASALVEEARRIGSRIGARMIELRSIRAAVRGVSRCATHVTFRKPLPDSIEEVMTALPRKARAAARQAAARHALSVEFGDANLQIVWQLYARSMRRLASPNYPYRFFEELVEASPGQHLVQLVRVDNRPVAGLLTFLYRDSVMPYFAGLDERSGVSGLNNFLYLKSMEWGVSNGYRIFDFGRSRIDNPGPLNFKRFCGFEPTPLEYQQLTMPGREAPNLSPGAPQWAVARRVWRNLPLTITRPLGGWLAKSIPG